MTASSNPFLTVTLARIAIAQSELQDPHSQERAGLVSFFDAI
jgi:hypothetical protein